MFETPVNPEGHGFAPSNRSMASAGSRTSRSRTNTNNTNKMNGSNAQTASPLFSLFSLCGSNPTEVDPPQAEPSIITTVSPAYICLPGLTETTLGRVNRSSDYNINSYSRSSSSSSSRKTKNSNNNKDNGKDTDKKILMEDVRTTWRKKVARSLWVGTTTRTEHRPPPIVHYSEQLIADNEYGARAVSNMKTKTIYTDNQMTMSVGGRFLSEKDHRFVMLMKVRRQQVALAFFYLSVCVC